MALIVTLGILTIITLAVAAFVVTIRIERLAARNALNRTMARQYVDVALVRALAFSDGLLAWKSSSYPVQGWCPNCYTNLFVSHFSDGDCLGYSYTNEYDINGNMVVTTCETTSLFRGSITNLVPGALTAQASRVESIWLNIMESNTTTHVNNGIAGRVTFLVINLSGMMDANSLNTNRLQALGEPCLNISAPATGGYTRVFLTQHDLIASNRGPVSSLVTLSYDPDPDVYPTNADADVLFGTRGFTNVLDRRFNINSATNFMSLANYVTSSECAAWLASVSNRLAEAEVPFSDQVAWNILNYISPGQIPVTNGSPAYRTGYCVKDVPLINEVALEQINTNPEYGVSVELWYPFVPHSSPTNTTLRVGVYTNAADALAAISTNSTPSPPSMCFESPVAPLRNYGDATEFFVDGTTNHPLGSVLPISFKEITTTVVYHAIGPDYRVWILPRVYVGDTCVDEALVDATPGAPASVHTWTSIGDVQFADPRANNTLTPGIASFTNTPSLRTTNANCSVSCLPLVIADAPMLSAGELRHIYAPGMTNACLDLASLEGALCRDRFTVRETNTPVRAVRGLVHANTPYTNVWKAILSDIDIGWTNSVPLSSRYCGKFFAATPAGYQDTVTVAVAMAAWNGMPDSTNSWNCYADMLPLVAANLDTNALTLSERGDILAGIADRVSFRQNVFLVIACGQRLSPRGRVLADQRAAAVIVRDAFTGRWVVNHMIWLTE